MFFLIFGNFEDVLFFGFQTKWCTVQSFGGSFQVQDRTRMVR